MATMEIDLHRNPLQLDKVFRPHRVFRVTLSQWILEIRFGWLNLMLKTFKTDFKYKAVVSS